MKYSITKKLLGMAIGVLIAVTAFPALSLGASIVVDMDVELTSASMPDGADIPMWGYRINSLTRDLVDETPAHPAGVWQIPVIRAVAADSLEITLNNTLSAVTDGYVEPTSIMIPGQTPSEAFALQPVWTDGTPGDRAGDFAKRVRSFTHEAEVGSSDTYVWNSLKPGTYLIQSATHPSVQMQMGLYGVLIVDAVGGVTPEAYAGLTYDNEVTLLYSEIDPTLHSYVANGYYGLSQQDLDLIDPGLTAMTSTFDYNPRYYLINGQPYNATTADIDAGNSGESVLFRFLNAGIESHVPVYQGGFFKVIAEDGNAYPYPREGYSIVLPPGKTKDAYIPQAAGGTWGLYDRSLDLGDGTTNAGLFAVVSNTVQAVTSAAISANMTSPVSQGAQVTFTASALGGSGNYEYRFVVQDLGDSSFLPDAGYGTSNVFTWNTGGLLGSFEVFVYVRNAGSAAPSEAVASMVFDVEAAPPVTGVTLAADLPSPVITGQTVNFTATGTGGSGFFEHRFRVRDLNNPAWVADSGYSMSPNFAWDTTGLTGSYRVIVYTRNVGSTVASEAVAYVRYEVQPGAPVTAVSLTPDALSPVLVGTTVNFVAAATGTTGSYEYRFRVRDLDNPSWVDDSGYTTNPNFAWDTTGLDGNFRVIVYARNVGSTLASEAVSYLAYDILPGAPVTAVSLTPDTASPVDTGTTVNFVAAATGTTGSYEYRFRVRDLDNPSWVDDSGYTTNPNFAWDTTGLDGNFRVIVYARNVGSTLASEAVSYLTYVVNVP